MLFHPVFTGPPVYPPLDTLGIMFYTTLFVTVTLLTMRRPAYGVAALAASIPFGLYQEVHGTTIDMAKVSVLAVLLGLSVHRAAFAPLGQKAPRRILAAGLLVLAITAVSWTHAEYRWPVVRESLKALEYLLIFCAAAAAYRLDPDRRIVRYAVLGTTIAVCLLALAQEVVGSSSALLINGHAVPRLAGPLEGPNQLAGYLDVALPLAFALAIDRFDLTAGVALALCAWTDVLTFSRAGIIAAVVGLAVVAAWHRRGILKALAPLAVGALAALCVDAAWAFSVHTSAVTAFRVTKASTTYAGGVGTRAELWHAAFVLWKRHPYFGVGAGNFQLEIAQTGLRGVRTHANSLYIQSIVEGGIPAIGATLWLVYVSISSFAARRVRSPFVAGALAGSIALALHQVVDFLTFYPKVGGEWWLVMALGAAELAAASV